MRFLKVLEQPLFVAGASVVFGIVARPYLEKWVHGIPFPGSPKPAAPSPASSAPVKGHDEEDVSGDDDDDDDDED